MKRFIGLVALLSWLATPWLWWQSERPVPRATALQQVNGGTMQFFTSDAQLFICGDDDHIRVYDVRRGERLATWPRSLNAVGTFCGSPDGPALVAFHAGEKVELFDLINGKTVASFAPGPGSPVRIHLAPNGKLAATDHDNQTLRVWDLGTGRSLAEFAFPQSSIGYVTFSPDSMQLAVTEAGGRAKVINLSTREVKVCPSSLNRAICMTVFAPDGRLLGLAMINADEFGLWDLTSDQLLVRCPRASGGFLGGGSYWYVNHYPFWPLSSLAEKIGAGQLSRLFIDIRRERRIFDTKSGRMVACVPQAISGMFPDGKTLATFSREEDCVQLWDVPASTMVHPFLAWGVLGLGFVFTGWWWHLRRPGPKQKNGIENESLETGAAESVAALDRGRHSGFLRSTVVRAARAAPEYDAEELGLVDGPETYTVNFGQSYEERRQRGFRDYRRQQWTSPEISIIVISEPEGRVVCRYGGKGREPYWLALLRSWLSRWL
jgi:WD40 repeat protein